MESTDCVFGWFFGISWYWNPTDKDRTIIFAKINMYILAINSKLKVHLLDHLIEKVNIGSV